MNSRAVKAVAIVMMAVVLGHVTKWLLKSTLLSSHPIFDDLLVFVVIYGVIRCPHFFPRLFNGECPICGEVFSTH